MPEKDPNATASKSVAVLTNEGTIDPATGLRSGEGDLIRETGLTFEDTKKGQLLWIPLFVTLSEREWLFDVASGRAASRGEDKKEGLHSFAIRALHDWFHNETNRTMLEEFAKKSNRAKVSDLTPDEINKQLARMQRTTDALMAALKAKLGEQKGA